MFCKGIKEVSATNKFLISFDVCSLFNNIPFKQTIDIAVNLLFEYNPGSTITKSELKKLFEFETSGTYFLFQGTFYNHIDSVAMVLPLVLSLRIFSWVMMKLGGSIHFENVKYFYIDNTLMIR